MSENHYAEFSECSMKPQEVLEYVSGPIPVPEEGEVLVRMKAAPINPADINFVQGVYGLKPVLPHSPAPAWKAAAWYRNLAQRDSEREMK